MILNSGVGLILWLLFAHWFADFFCQTNWMAVNKSKDTWALASHVFVYSVIMGVFFWVVTLDFHKAWAFCCFMYCTHFAIDFVTSRLTSRLFAQWFMCNTVNVDDVQPRPTLHNFFVVIGFDQFLHFATILGICGVWGLV
jgi:hypothetical protein